MQTKEFRIETSDARVVMPKLREAFKILERGHLVRFVVDVADPTGVVSMLRVHFAGKLRSVTIVDVQGGTL